MSTVWRNANLDCFSRIREKYVQKALNTAPPEEANSIKHGVGEKFFIFDHVEFVSVVRFVLQRLRSAHLFLGRSGIIGF